MENKERNSLPPLPGTERTILALLVENSAKELYGLEMIAASGGKLKRGSIYVTLQRMQEKGLVDSREEPRPMPEVGIPRRMYKATGFGVRVLRAYEVAELAISSAAVRL